MNLLQVSAWRRQGLALLLAGLCSAVSAGPSYAAIVYATYSTSGKVGTTSDEPVSAEAVFAYDTDTGKLTITLTNTSDTNTASQGQVLAGIFFTLSSDPTLSLSSATGTIIYGDKDGTVGTTSNASLLVSGDGYALAQNPGGTVSSESQWAYEYGISTTGFGVFGDVNGDTYGIVSTEETADGKFKFLDGLTSTNIGKANENRKYFVDTTATFVVTGLPEGFTFDQILSVAFIWNSTGDVTGLVPEPMSMLGFGAGGIGLLAFGLRRRRKTNII